jgi:hypothetical protein
MNTIFKPGKVAPTTQILTDVQPCSPECIELLKALGFQDVGGDGRTFVYNSGGRGIWVDSVTEGGQIMPLVCAASEQIGQRTKINEIRHALDLPLGVVSDEHSAPLLQPAKDEVETGNPA